MKISQNTQKLAFLLKNNFLIAGTAYALSISLANHWGPEIFGQYSSILALSTILNLFIMFATNQTAPVMRASGVDPKEIVTSILSIRIAALLTILLLYMIFSKLESNLEYEININIALYAILYSITSLNASFIYEMNRKIVLYSYIYMAERLFYIAIIAFLLVYTQIELAIVVGVYTATSAMSIIYQYTDNRKVFNSIYLTKTNILNTIRNNFPLVLAALSAYVYTGGSRLLIAIKFSFYELGLYAAGWQVVVAATLFQSQVDRVWRLDLSIAIHEKDQLKFKKLLLSYFLLSTLPIFSGAVLLFCSSEYLEKLLFSLEYKGVSSIFRILAFYFVVLNLDGLMRVLWTGTYDRMSYLLLILMGALSLATLYILMPPELGVNVFAIVLVLVHASVVTLLMCLFYQRHYAKWGR